VLYHGNVDQPEAERAAAMLKRLVPATKNQTLPQTPARRFSVVEIPRGSLNVFLAPSDEPSEKTCALHLYYQLCEDTPENQAVAELLETLMDEPLFDELRTKQQLGYVVSCGLRRTHGVLGFTVEITSSKFSPTECLRRFDAFLKRFREEELSDIGDAELRKRAEALSRRILQKDVGIFQETKRHWNPIFEQSYRFNEKWLVAHHVLHAPKSNGRFGVTGKELLQFFDRHFDHNSRRALLVLIVGGGNTELTDLAKEKASLPANALVFDSTQQFWDRYPQRFQVNPLARSLPLT
jgi:secreted Zn-dependent insulinase-like peptidase